MLENIKSQVHYLIQYTVLINKQTHNLMNGGNGTEVKKKQGM